MVASIYRGVKVLFTSAKFWLTLNGQNHSCNLGSTVCCTHTYIHIQLMKIDIATILAAHSQCLF